MRTWVAAFEYSQAQNWARRQKLPPFQFHYVNSEHSLKGIDPHALDERFVALEGATRRKEFSNDFWYRYPWEFVVE